MQKEYSHQNVISSPAVPLIFSGSDSSTRKLKLEALLPPGPKSSEITNPREKLPDGDQRRKKPVFMVMTV